MNEFQLAHLAYRDLVKLRDAVNRAIPAAKKKSRAIGIARRAQNHGTDIAERFQKKDAEESACNRASLLALPNRRRVNALNLLRFFPALIGQDWSSIYPPTGGDKKFYVYAHVDPRLGPFATLKECGGNFKGLPFYIGKGCGPRAYDLKRNQGHGARIRELIELGFSPESMVHLIREELDEGDALALEAKLIYYFFGSVHESGRRAQKRACLFNLDIPKTPDFKAVMSDSRRTVTNDDTKDEIS